MDFKYILRFFDFEWSCECLRKWTLLGQNGYTMEIYNYYTSTTTSALALRRTCHPQCRCTQRRPRPPPHPRLALPGWHIAFTWPVATSCPLGLWPLLHHAPGGHCPGNIAVGPGYNYCECIDILFCSCCPVVFIFDALLQVVLGTTKLCLRSRLNRGFKKSVRLFPWL